MSKNRVVPSPFMPIYEDSQIRGEATGPSTEVSHITVEDGIRVHLKGYPHYVRGYPTFQAVQAINIVKKALTASPLTVALTTLAPITMRQELMCPVARELRKMISGQCSSSFRFRLGLILSHIVEYDSAYRLRLQDALTATSQEALRRAPIREIWACVAHNRKNDYLAVHKKIRRVAWVLTIMLLWPPLRSKWRAALSACHWEALLPDDADRYWIAQRDDYGPNNLNPIV